MNAGDIVQYRKVGKARLISREAVGMYDEKWVVEFLTGRNKNKDRQSMIWVRESDVIERAEVVPVVETVAVAPVATEASVEVAPLVAAITPAMADMLSSHSGASESLDSAQDAGVTWTDGVLTVPASGWYQLNWFLGMRAELAMENGVDCPSIVLSKFVSEAR